MAKSKKKRATPAKKPKTIKLTEEQVEKLISQVSNSNLDDSASSMVVELIKGNRWLIEAIERGKVTLQKLRKALGIETSEKAKARKNAANNKKSTDNSNKENDTKKSAKKGHGRIAADAYSGAKVMDVEHDTLIPGGECPDVYCDGRLYEMSEPGVVMRVTGGQLATATRFNLQKLRCSICETIYTAKLPKEVGDKKYDNTFISMLMLNKYFMSIPYYRQENLQRALGIPLPASTQSELISEQRDVLKALYDAFCFDAAQAKGFSIDDTSAKVLEQIQKSKKDKKETKACFTTGIVSVHDDHLSYIYMTDKDTAGKSLAPFFDLRNEALDIPYVMSDALSANIPNNTSKSLYILCYCLTHARRQFYDLPDGYDDLSDRVIDLIGKIYDNEAHAKTLSAEARLTYHQEHSQPIMAELKQFLEAQALEFEPNSIAGKAINYMLKRWTELSQFYRYLNVPMDTNIVERALKLIIQTRKSSLFYKTLKSAELASYIQTALYSAAQNNINPYEYMTAILTHKTKVIASASDWLPWRYHKTMESLAESNGRQGSVNVPGVP